MRARLPVGLISRGMSICRWGLLVVVMPSLGAIDSMLLLPMSVLTAGDTCVSANCCEAICILASAGALTGTLAGAGGLAAVAGLGTIGKSIVAYRSERLARGYTD